MRSKLFVLLERTNVFLFLVRNNIFPNPYTNNKGYYGKIPKVINIDVVFLI